MRHAFLFAIVLLACAVPSQARAQVVIGEVLWPGSDLSTSDEWLEITSIVDVDTDLSAWTLTSLNTKGEHSIALTFATGSHIGPGESLVISSRVSSASRLRAEPAFVASSLTLPNTKLLLRLRDAHGAIVDEVDDGVGAPFAGANPSGTGAKASMERIELHVAGTLKENWRTSTQSLGFDDGARVLGTPGILPTVEPEELITQIVQSSSSSSSSASSVACTDPLQISLNIQSGPVSGVGKVTVNMQAVATAGSLSSSACSWNFGDGFTSTSCNPSTHSFTNPGTYVVHLEAKNHCGDTLVQEQKIDVLPDGTSSSAASMFYDGSRLIFSAALPNPEGADTGKEWIELHNPEDHGVDLSGWKLAVGETSIQSFALKGSLSPGDNLRIFDAEIKFKLPNTASKLQLISPSGTAMSTVVWKSTDEGRTYYADDIRDAQVSGTVLRLLGRTSFELQLDAEATRILDKDRVIITMLGIRSATSDERTSKSSDESEDQKYVEALMKNKKVELEFDSILWDDRGSLLAYVYGDGSLSIQEYLLSTGRWVTDTDEAFLLKKRFQDLQNKTSDAHGSVATLLPSVQKTAQEKAMQAVRADVSGLSLSEVFPSPYPPSDTSHEGLLKSEWIEIRNYSQHLVDLSALVIRIDGTKKVFKDAPKALSGSLLVLRIADIGGRLKNTGGSVALLDAKGSVISELTYPEIKNGYSYAAVSSGESFCVTASPTPGATNQCVTMTNQKKAVAAKKPAATTKKVSAQVKAYAASYRAQVVPEGSEESSISDIVLEDDPAPQSGVGLLGVAFIFGCGFSALGTFLVLRKRSVGSSLVQSRSSEVHSYPPAV